MHFIPCFDLFGCILTRLANVLSSHSAYITIDSMQCMKTSLQWKDLRTKKVSWFKRLIYYTSQEPHTACIPHLILHKCPLNWIKPFKGVKITWKLIKCPSTVNNYFKLPSFYKIRQICASEIPLQAFHIKLGHTLIDGR